MKHSIDTDIDTKVSRDTYRRYKHLDTAHLCPCYGWTTQINRTLLIVYTRGGQTFKGQFEKTVKAAGRTLIGKQGKDLFSFFFLRSQSTYECDLQNKRFSLRFSF